MGCDCNCADITIDCQCTTAEPIDGASLDTVTSTTFSGAPANIYNSGSGYNTLVYTNTSSTNQFIIIDTNTYITSDNPHTLTTYYTLNGATGEANATNDGLILRHTSAPVKSPVTHLSAGILIGPGTSIWFNMVSDDSTARAVWLTSVIYKYTY